MAGTPTPNYNFPTYAETDVPDLAGAYNQAVNAIDAKIKEVADTIPSDVDVPDANSTTKGIAKLYDSSSIGDSTQEDGGVTPAALKAAVEGASVDVSGKADKFTVTYPITYSDNQIGVSLAVPDDPSKYKGIVAVTGNQSNIASATDPKTPIVPNVKAVRDYVDAKVPTEQQAYTGTAPIVVNSGEHTIGIRSPQQVNNSNYTDYLSKMQESDSNIINFTGSSYPILDGTSTANAIYAVHNDSHNWPAAFCTPNLATTIGLIKDTFTSSSLAATNATTPLTTEMLANLYVTPSGMVVYKAPSE